MFILITPSKNEEEFIKKIASKVITQTIKPVLWVIVDDGSVDSSPEIIKELKRDHAWIHSFRLPEHPRDITSHYSHVCKKGFDFAIDHCSQHSIEYQYIALLDADTLLEKTYFEQLIHEFERDESLGIASGCIVDDADECLHLPEKEWKNIPSQSPNKDSPRGTGRMWRKECFIDTGGYVIEPSPDTISNIKALNRGWKIVQFDPIRAIQLRPTSSAEGVWKGYLSQGGMAYHLNKPFILVLGGAFYFSQNKPHFQGLPYMIGYISAIIHRKPQIEDEEIKKYWNKRITSIFSR